MDKSKVLKGAVDAIKDLVTDANFDCSSVGMQMQAMDSNHVSLVSLLLRKDGFSDYRCDRNISLGINLESLAKVMKCSGADDSVNVTASDQGDTASFLFESEKTQRASEFELKLMDIDSEHLDIPDTEFQCTIEMSSAEFQRICRDMSVIGDTITISASKEGVSFSVNGDMGSGQVSLKNKPTADGDEKDNIVINLESEVSLTFALRYLTLFSKASSLSEKVVLSMSEDVPLSVEYKIDDVGYIRYYLAPKIEEE